jgi:dCMP deaminase
VIAHRRTDAEWLRAACLEAARSHDPSTQNAAIIVTLDSLVAVGINKVPGGVYPLPTRLVRPEKYEYVEHAERAAIYSACRYGMTTKGATMFCPWFACVDCARGIILSGIRQVVGHVRTRAATPERWLESIQKAEAMLDEAGVGMRWIADPLGVTIRFNEEEMPL